MILSTADVSKYLNDVSTTYADYIPMIVDDFFTWTNNYFESEIVYLRGQIFDFSSAGTITATGTNFSTRSFYAGDNIRVYGSCRNDGYYEISSMTGSVLSISTSGTFKAEGRESYVKISKIDVPEGAKRVMSQMLKFNIDNVGATPVSESLGDYSVNYGKISGGYPQSIASNLDKYSLVGFQ